MTWRDPSRVVVVAAAAALAIVSPRPWAGSWNDGSRLATVETLVDHHTLAIDQSIFVTPALAATPPYDPGNRALAANGTLDKLYIHGHFYSDKSPVPALVLGAEYAILQRATGVVARERPAAFIYGVTLASSGLSFVIAVAAMLTLARRLLPPRKALILTASFALATVAPTYTRQVNNHIFLLAIASWLTLLWDELVREPAALDRTALFAAVGIASGAGYTVDLGVGPMFLIASGCLVAMRRSARGAIAFAAGALPFLLLHHALTYQLAGGLAPANSVAAYLDWPGSPFSNQTMTGRWGHASVGHFLGYAVQMMVGRRGFLLFNLPLLVATPALVWLARYARGIVEWPAIVAAGAVNVASWIAYAALSNNYSGVCVSIRWFVPLLATSFYIIAVWLRERPNQWPVFLVLTAWGVVLSTRLWIGGPWVATLTPLYWGCIAAALSSSLVMAVRAQRHQPEWRS